MKRIIFSGLLACLLISCQPSNVADKVVIGRTWTGSQERAWSAGLAFDGDSIVAVSDQAGLRRWIGDDTKVIELDSNNLIVPGFIDCHTHFVDGGFALSSVHLRDARSPEEFIERIKAYALTIPRGTWILNGDWDHENWGGVLPDRAWIDSVTQDHPVWINRLDGHMSLANSLALSAAGITDKTRDVPGGLIVRDKGRVTGVLKDNAMSLVDRVVPPPTEEQEDRSLEAAMDYVLSHGVTSVHNMSGYHDLFARAHSMGKLRTRIYAGMMLSDWALLNEKIKERGLGDKWLRIGSLKAFVDGSLGSHTAAFFDSYVDNPKDSGFFVTDQRMLYRRVKSADSLGLQVMVHAIGDRAIHSLLDIYERVAKENGPRDRRFRIEHAQHIHPGDLYRFASQGIIASMQPYHAIDDGRWATRVIGFERSKTTYAFRSLLDLNARVVFGSDWFVAPPIPLQGIYAAVTRRTLDGANPEGWMPQQKISVEEALRAYTIDAAYASFEERIKGSLEPGKLADFVVLSQDITRIPPEDIIKVEVLATVVGGRTEFAREGSGFQVSATE